MRSYSSASWDQHEMSVLEAGARQEGQLTWYTSLTGPIIDRLLAGYKQKYPFVEPEAFRAAENELLTKSTQEAQAGRQVGVKVASRVAFMSWAIRSMAQSRGFSSQSRA